MLNSILGSIMRFVLRRWSQNRLPKIDGKLNLSGLVTPVEILRDRWGIPHIYAENEHDLFFAQGFVHAQDRFWQMETNRRIANGTLSELFGEIALDTDRTTRTFGFSRLGQIDWKNSASELRAAIQAYTDGVNAFLQHPDSQLPVEFKLLGHQPEPWKPEDSLAFARVMLWQLSHAWYGEIIRTLLIKAVGVEHAAELEIEYPESNPITLPEGIEFNILDKDGTLKGAKGPFLSRGQGSNTWAVSGHKTTTGSAFLCNDMHLSLTLPGLWYECHLVTADGYNVSGVTLPGVPFVMVGHNAKIAWGMTLAFTDAEDLFLEKINPDNPYQYEYEGTWQDAEVISETINVKDRSEPHIEKVIITRHGPIISDAVNYSHDRLSVQSMALRPSRAFQGWLQLNKASSWDNFVEAMQLIDAPQLNVSYADTEGNIGYWVTGKVPVRKKGQGMVPASGWTGEYEWIGEVPFEEMPHAFNPKCGYIVNCNNRIIPPGYPHFLGSVWMNGYRARRALDIIESKDKLSSEDFKAIQLDLTCIPGLKFVKCLENIGSQDPDVHLALERLRSWDGQLTTSSVGGTVYEVACYFAVRKILEPELGESLTNSFMGVGFHPILYSGNEFGGHETSFLLRLLDNPDSWWLKRAGGKEKLLNQSLKDAINWLKQNLGKNPDKWQWGRIHRITFAHAMSQRKPLDKVFNRGPLPIGGDKNTLCQTALVASDPFDLKGSGPSHRQIINMGNLGKSLMVYPPGQSGHLASSHYDDLINLWYKGEYHPMLWTRDQVEAETEGSLILEPQ
ncbi:MAG: penicillin acylase family protein [Candidatus Hodarchaeota archaeon]